MNILQNQTIYNRSLHDSNNPYLMISSKLINDKRLTNDELLIMIKILSNSDSYIFNSTFLQKEMKLGQIKFYSAIKNLIKYGYLKKKGSSKTKELHIEDETLPLPSTEVSVSTTTDLSSTQNSSLININKISIKEDTGPITGPDKIEITGESTSIENFEESVDVSLNNNCDESFINNSSTSNAVSDVPVKEEKIEVPIENSLTDPVIEDKNKIPTETSATSNFNVREYLKEFFDRIKDRTSTVPVDIRVPMIFNDILNKIDNTINMNIFINELSICPELTSENRERIAKCLE